MGQAFLFASQSTFGLPYAKIVELADIGHEQWLDQQMALPATLNVPEVESLLARHSAGEFNADPLADDLPFSFHRFAWWHSTLTAEDQLRHRVAFALSEIFVVSDTLDALAVYPYALSSYYDVLLSHSFGN